MVPSECMGLNALWSIYFLPSDLKTFLFKLHHNILGLNSRVHHFNEQRDPACFFCTKTGNLPAERETFQHFFWYCPTTEKIINKFWETFFSGTLCKKGFFQV
jgi:hypothetical protein